MDGPPAFRAFCRFHACISGLLLTALVVWLSVGFDRPAAAWQAEDAPILTGDRVKVVAQGVAALPAGDVAWRTVRTRALPLDEAVFEARPLGFVLATSGPLLLTDRDSGDQVRLGPGEAAFVRDGVVQQRASLTGVPSTYLSIELVEGGAPPSPEGAVVLQPGQPFPAPSGLRDLDLISGTLLGDETVAVLDTGFKNVVLITEGAAAAGRTSGEPVVLLAGEAATFSGELQITSAPGGEQRAGFVVATIGAEVPPPPNASRSTSVRSEPAAPASPVSAGEGQGSISLQIYACPPGMDAANLAAAACAANPEGADVTLTSSALSSPLRVSDAAASVDSLVWSYLPFGDYRIEAPVLPAGATSYLVSAKGATGDSSSGFTVPLSPENPDLFLRVYVFFPG